MPTNGQVAFYDGGWTGEDNLYWDKNNDRLGVKTNSPAYALDIRKSNEALRIGDEADTTNDTGVYVTHGLDKEGWIYFADDDKNYNARVGMTNSGQFVLAALRDMADPMRIVSHGGIDFSADVNNNSDAHIRFFFNDDDQNGMILEEGDGDGKFVWRTHGGIDFKADNDNDDAEKIRFFFNNAGTPVLQLDETSSGVMVKNTNFKVDGGNIHIIGTDPHLRFSVSHDDAFGYHTDDEYFFWKIAGTERMRLDGTELHLKDNYRIDLRWDSNQHGAGEGSPDEDYSLLWMDVDGYVTNTASGVLAGIGIDLSGYDKSSQEAGFRAGLFVKTGCTYPDRSSGVWVLNHGNGDAYYAAVDSQTNVPGSDPPQRFGLGMGIDVFSKDGGGIYIILHDIAQTTEYQYGIRIDDQTYSDETKLYRAVGARQDALWVKEASGRNSVNYKMLRLVDSSDTDLFIVYGNGKVWSNAEIEAKSKFVVNGVNGFSSGTFTSADGKTVTVTGGIVTNIV